MSGSCTRDAGRLRTKLIVLAIGIVLMGIGIMMLFDRDGGRWMIGQFRRGPHPSAVGLMVCGIGLVFTVLALLHLARVCPRWN